LMSEGDTVAFDMGKEESGALKESANRDNLTLYMVLFAVYTILLAKLSSQEDIVVGTPAAGRPHPDLAPLVGMFVNTLALRAYPAGEKGIGDYLDEIRRDTLQAFENQDYQFEELVNRVVVDRAPNRNPLFDVMFVLQNVEKKEEGPGRDLRLNPVTFHAGTARFPLVLEVTGTEALTFSFTYSTRLFRKESIERFSGYFKKIVAEKKFREDLFYRLFEFDIYIPPLRERREDIPMLAQRFFFETVG
ncbi:MAG: hypothetical protein GY950_10920, partial [bacterium]|nr:hypothetical protein [bacterium]